MLEAGVCLDGGPASWCSCAPLKRVAGKRHCSALQERERPQRWRAAVVTGEMVGLWKRKSGGDGGHGSSVEFFEDEDIGGIF